MPAAPRKGELSMEIKEYQAAIEAVLFASGEPVAATRLAEVLELDLETSVRLADDWLQDVNTRGGGLLAVRQGRGRSLLMGFGAGLILFLLLLTAGFLFYESADLRNGGLGLLLSCGCGGALAGVLGGKPKKKRRR